MSVGGIGSADPRGVEPCTVAPLTLITPPLRAWGCSRGDLEHTNNVNQDEVDARGVGQVVERAATRDAPACVTAARGGMPYTYGWPG